MIRCGVHDNIRVRPTRSGGRRVSSLDKTVTGVVYLNRGNIVVVWPGGVQEIRRWPRSLAGAVNDLRSKIRAILAQKKCEMRRTRPEGKIGLTQEDEADRATSQLRDQAIAAACAGDENGYYDQDGVWVNV